MVSVEDTVGVLSDLIGSPITLAEKTTNEENPPRHPDTGEEPDSFTWTFYRFATAKGYVTIRWLGESNGYYSESVDFGPYKEKTPREEEIRKSSPFDNNCPASIIADWLEDKNRVEDAEFMRLISSV